MTAAASAVGSAISSAVSAINGGTEALASIRAIAVHRRNLESAIGTLRAVELQLHRRNRSESADTEDR
jgi:hypothetical protein